MCIFGLKHPQRPRGSQSGREKRWNESFQVQAKEPLGTDSHRTTGISKNSSRCQLLIGHKKCFVLLCPISEQFALKKILSTHSLIKCVEISLENLYVYIWA